jgi:hypothetical protein
MISASLYIILCSARNRFRRRLRRLREPRYLIGAIVGVAYFYFAIFARMRGRAAADAARNRNLARRGTASAEAVTSALIASGPALAGLGFLALSIVAWVLPFDSGLIEFSEAETDFLFPAPVSRRQLLIHRLLRSQLGIIFGAVVVSFASLNLNGWMRLRISIGTWLVFLTMKVYFTVVTLSRGRFRSKRAVERALAWMPLAALAAAAIVIGVALRQAFGANPVEHLSDAIERIGAVSLTGASRIALWPFETLARPLFATTASGFARAAGPALMVLGVLVAWMLRSDERFQEAAALAAAQRAERIQARRAAVIRARSTGLSLGLAGRAESAFFWKNGVQTLRLAGPSLVRVVAVTILAVMTGTSAAVNRLHLRGSAAAVFAVASLIALFSAILAPQIIRTDLRSDLRHLDLLKTWPVRAATVIRGEMAWPGTMLTVLGSLAVVCAWLFAPSAFPGVPALTLLSIAIAAVVLMPAVVFSQYLVQNAAAVVFPAWVPLGDQRPRGLEAIGQRLILLAGVLVSVTLLMLPGVVAGAVLLFAFRRWVGMLILVPASLVCTLIVALEVLAGTEMLAPLYDKLDLLSVERAD